MHDLAIGQRVWVDSVWFSLDRQEGTVVEGRTFTQYGLMFRVKFDSGEKAWFHPPDIHPIYSGAEVVAAQIRIHADMPLALVGDDRSAPAEMADQFEVYMIRICGRC